MGDRVGSTASPPHYHKHSLHNFFKQPQQPDFHFKISGFLAAIKLTDKSGYPDNGYPDMQTLDATCHSKVAKQYGNLPMMPTLRKNSVIRPTLALLLLSCYSSIIF